MGELGWWIALGLANLTALLDPSVIVIGGGLAAAGDLLARAHTSRAYAEIVYARRRPPGGDHPGAALGELAGAVGAALVARGDERKSTGTRPMKTDLDRLVRHRCPDDSSAVAAGRRRNV